jgi:hypothetical protein
MSLVKGPLAIWLVPAALGVGAIGAIDGSIERAGAGSNASQPIRCEIQVKEHGNSVALEGVVFTKAAIEGSYQLRVSKSGGGGSSDINQSGDFSAGPGEPSTVGPSPSGAMVGPMSSGSRLRGTADRSSAPNGSAARFKLQAVVVSLTMASRMRPFFCGQRRRK